MMSDVCILNLSYKILYLLIIELFYYIFSLEFDKYNLNTNIIFIKIYLIH